MELFHDQFCAATDQPVVNDGYFERGPFGLLALSGDAPQAVLQRRGVEIRGDAVIADRFRELGMLLRPDLESRS